MYILCFPFFLNNNIKLDFKKYFKNGDDYQSFFHNSLKKTILQKNNYIYYKK